MTIGNSGIDGNFLTYPGQAANTLLANNTAGTAAPTAITVESAQILLGKFGLVSGSNATRTAQTLADIAGLTVALSASATYAFEAVLSCLTSADTNGTEYAVQFSQSGATIESQITGSLSTTASKTERITALNTATSAYMTGNAQTGGIIISGTIVTTTNAGNLTIQHLKVTGGTSTVYIGSYLTASRIA